VSRPDLCACQRADGSAPDGGFRAYRRALVAAAISESVRRFIAQHVHSAGQLEVLLLLRAMPDRDWSIEDVARTHVSAPVLAEQMLEDLWRRGLAERSGKAERYRYAPPAELVPVIDELAEAYATRRVTVVGLIFASERIATEAHRAVPRSPGNDGRR
jgi:hypothetical protein